MRTLSIALALTALGVLVSSPGAIGAPRETLIAALVDCPHQGDVDASTEERLQAMRCMTNLARRRARLDSLASPSSLSSSSQRKAQDILRCDSISHFACGRSFIYWMKRSGYLGSCWRVAENIAWGTRSGTARSIFQTWLRSPEHRRNIFGPYDDLGVGMETGKLNGHEGVRVWIQHFGARC